MLITINATEGEIYGYELLQLQISKLLNLLIP